jgi:tol-pal system protein YbgF
MKSTLFTLKLLTYFLPFLALLSCAENQYTNEQLMNLQLQMTELQKSQTDSNSRMEELNNQLFLIQEKMESNAEDIQQLNNNIEDFKSQALIAAPPEELDTYSMAPLTLKEEQVNEISEKDNPLQQKPNVDIQKSEEDIQEQASIIPGKAEGGEHLVSKEAETPEDIYTRAYTLYEKRNYPESHKVFHLFLQRFPNHLLSDNAQYWIGEVFYSQRDFNKAITEFSKVLDIYPQGNKAPDALYKMSLSYEALEDKSGYIDTLKKLVASYPTSGVALKAQEKLKVLEP